MASNDHARLRVVSQYDSDTGIGIVDAYIDNSKVSGYDRGLMEYPVAYMKYRIGVPGTDFKVPPIGRVKRGRRDAFIQIEYLENWITSNPGRFRALPDAEKVLVKGLAGRLMCNTIRDLLKQELLSPASMIVLYRGYDRYDKSLADYYKKMGFVEYFHTDKADELYPYRHMDSAMEVSVRKFLNHCAESGRLVRASLRKKRVSVNRSKSRRRRVPK